MVLKIGLNGYGRIGRCLHRQSLNDSSIDIVAINTRTQIDPLLLKFDSIYGKLNYDIFLEKDYLCLDYEGQNNPGKKRIKLYNESDLEKILWQGLDVIIDCSGKFKKYIDLEKHLLSADKVLLTCPPKDDIKQIVMGVNEQIYAGEKIVSNASCTTNALAPVLKIIDDAIGIEYARFLSVHALTASQNILDNSHKDSRRARSCLNSIIPTTSGATKAIEKIMPSLIGKIEGSAVRVPILSGSLLKIDLDLSQPYPSLLELFENSGKSNIIGVCHDELVSSDFIGDARSCIIDAKLSKSYGTKAQLFVWYDNEWGYTSRIIDLVKYIS